MTEKIRLGISSCLMGEQVRYDGQHKLDRYLRDTLGEYVDYIPVCPEFELGLGVPRPTLRLVGDPAAPRLMFPGTGEDITERMQQWAHERCAALSDQTLDGYIFKAKSPSSGMTRIKVYPTVDGGLPQNNGVGIFARIFMDAFPLLPVEDEGRLHDPGLRENFIERIFVMRRWRAMCDENLSLKSLQLFHRQHKYLIMAHDPAACTALGRLVAEADDAKALDYLSGLMDALGKLVKLSGHVNVLQHLMGYLKKELSSDEKQELLDMFSQYRDGQIPLIVPITLMNHYVRKYGVDYLKDQFYLHPHPAELALRNHV